MWTVAVDVELCWLYMISSWDSFVIAGNLFCHQNCLRSKCLQILQFLRIHTQLQNETVRTNNRSDPASERKKYAQLLVHFVSTTEKLLLPRYGQQQDESEKKCGVKKNMQMKFIHSCRTKFLWEFHVFVRFSNSEKSQPGIAYVSYAFHDWNDTFLMHIFVSFDEQKAQLTGVFNVQCAVHINFVCVVLHHMGCSWISEYDGTREKINS